MRPRAARPLRTEGAKQSVDLALLFNVEIGRRRVAGFTPAMAQLQGQSTAGGKLARQPITLSKSTEKLVTLAMGSADTAAKTCSLKTFEVIERWHAARYPGRRFDLDRHEYAELFVAVSELMRKRGLEVEIDNDLGEREPDDAPVAADGRRTWVLVAAAVTVLLLAVLLIARLAR